MSLQWFLNRANRARVKTSGLGHYPILSEWVPSLSGGDHQAPRLRQMRQDASSDQYQRGSTTTRGLFEALVQGFCGHYNHEGDLLAGTRVSTG